ncbi:unnamed protein product, partial [Ectocarpus sp. 12 AP-2014]
NNKHHKDLQEQESLFFMGVVCRNMPMKTHLNFERRTPNKARHRPMAFASAKKGQQRVVTNPKSSRNTVGGYKKLPVPGIVPVKRRDTPRHHGGPPTVNGVVL